jgi:P27 family predicted phage terminase small subunit
MPRGGKPLPTAVLLNRGSWRAKLRKNYEVKVEPHLPECPAYLSDIGKAKWNEVAPRLFNLGILTALDSDALARWCSLWALWRQCHDFVMVETPGKQKNMLTLPQARMVRIMNQLSELLSKLEAQFGMNPSSRAALRVSPSQQQDDNDIRRFFKGH